MSKESSATRDERAELFSWITTKAVQFLPHVGDIYSFGFTPAQRHVLIQALSSLDLSRYVNAADISAADVPHVVVEKLQRVIDAGRIPSETEDRLRSTESGSWLSLLEMFSDDHVLLHGAAGEDAMNVGDVRRFVRQLAIAQAELSAKESVPSATRPKDGEACPTCGLAQGTQTGPME